MALLNHAGLRRALVSLVFIGVGFFVYLYWVQVGPIRQDYGGGGGAQGKDERYRLARNGVRKRFTDPLWTYVCASNRCEKREKSSDAPVSLDTCNMLCGSTQLWPQPTGPVQLGTHHLKFHTHQLRFETTAADPEHQFLERAYHIFKTNIKALIHLDEVEPQSQRSDIREFVIKVIVSSNNKTTLRLTTDESYNLTVRSVDHDLVATIRAKTFFGARHGLETLSQLIWVDEVESGVVLKVLKGASVVDAPSFAYRGLMLDTSRHYFSVAALKRLLIGMSSNKLNVFHWHISDSQSFPFDAPSVPQMAKYGATSPDEVYTGRNIQDLVDFARVRGIRIVIEMDTPAHAGNGWNWGPEENLGELAVCVNQQPWSLYCGEPPCGQLNPENPNIYKILEKLYKDILDLTQEREMFHLGGDEVNLHCWEQHQPIKISTPYNYTDLHDTWGEFTMQAMKRLQSANGGKVVPNIIMWSSDLTKRPYIDKYLNKHRTIVQTWGGSTWPETLDLLEDGYRVIISHVDAWYLDCGYGKWRETGGAACDPYRTWQTVYTHRPWSRMRLTPSKRSLVLGGEACLWTEQVDEVSLDTRLWPRVAAFAERLWTDPNIDLETLAIQEDVYTRLNTQRERLVRRGLQAEAMWPKWCAQNPGMCL